MQQLELPFKTTEYDEWLFRYLKSDRKKVNDLLRTNGYDIPHFKTQMDLITLI